MDRKQSIILLIHQAPSYITVREIAKVLYVSEKTVRNDLLDIEQYLLKNSCELVKKRGKGIAISGTASDVEKSIRFFQTRSEEQIDQPADRQRAIMMKLFCSKEAVLIKWLSAEFYVSRATINKDIGALNKWLKHFDVIIQYIKTEGLLTVGLEMNQRKAMSRAILFERTGSILDVIQYQETGVVYANEFQSIEKALSVEFIKIIEVIHDFEIECGCVFSTESKINLSLMIGISMNRKKNGYKVVLDRVLIETLRSNEWYLGISRILEQVQDGLHIDFDEGEKCFVLLHFLGAKVQKNVCKLNSGAKIKMQIGDKNVAIQNFIRRVLIDLGVNLKSGNLLYNSLQMDIIPAVNRVVNGLDMHNSLQDEIKKEYAELFEIVSRHIIIIEECFHVELPESEIVYMVLHFAAEIEKNYKTIRVLIACANGVGISQLLVAKIERMFKNIEIVAVISIHEIEQYRNDNVDLLVSTVQTNEIVWVKTLVVHPLLKDSDIEKMSKLLNRNQVRQNLDYLFLEENCFIDLKLFQKQDVLKFAFEKLIEGEFVTKEFYKTLETRENIGSTYIGNGVAVIHGDMAEVLDNCLQVMRLTESVLWDEENYVNLIINIVSKKEDSIFFSRIFRRMGEYLDDLNFWQQLRNAGSTKILADTLNKELAE
jgi:transcriptional antiterminator